MFSRLRHEMCAQDFAGTRSALVETLKDYKPSDEMESRHRDIVLAFALTHEHPFDRANLAGHLTASAVVVDAESERVLLGHHRKLCRWLQLGGHGEPEEECAEAVAMREATEESGIEGLVFYPDAPRPFDLDVHNIPEHKGIPQHNHLDIRFVLVAPAGAQPRHREDEHQSVRWFCWEETEELNLDMSLRRALKKVRKLAST